MREIYRHKDQGGFYFFEIYRDNVIMGRKKQVGQVLILDSFVVLFKE